MQFNFFTIEINNTFAIQAVLDWYNHKWFEYGVRDKFPLCCVFWFMNCWHDMDEDIIESWSSDRDGYIPCPECLARMLSKQLNYK